MSIYEINTIQACCDDCEEETILDLENKEEAINELIERGWHIKGELALCPYCRKENNIEDINGQEYFTGMIEKVDW